MSSSNFSFDISKFFAQHGAQVHHIPTTNENGEPFVRIGDPDFMKGVNDEAIRLLDFYKNSTKHNIFIICAQTGAGKSAYFPEYLHDQWCDEGQKINVFLNNSIAIDKLKDRPDRLKNDNEVSYSPSVKRSFFQNGGKIVFFDEIQSLTVSDHIYFVYLIESALKQTSSKLLLSSATFNHEELYNFLVKNDVEISNVVIFDYETIDRSIITSNLDDMHEEYGKVCTNALTLALYKSFCDNRSIISQTSGDEYQGLYLDACSKCIAYVILMNHYLDHHPPNRDILVICISCRIITAVHRILSLDEDLVNKYDIETIHSKLPRMAAKIYGDKPRIVLGNSSLGSGVNYKTSYVYSTGLIKYSDSRGDYLNRSFTKMEYLQQIGRINRDDYGGDGYYFVFLNGERFGNKLDCIPCILASSDPLLVLLEILVAVKKVKSQLNSNVAAINRRLIHPLDMNALNFALFQLTQCGIIIPYIADSCELVEYYATSNACLYRAIAGVLSAYYFRLVVMLDFICHEDDFNEGLLYLLICSLKSDLFGTRPTACKFIKDEKKMEKFLYKLQLQCEFRNTVPVDEYVGDYYVCRKAYLNYLSLKRNSNGFVDKIEFNDFIDMHDMNSSWFRELDHAFNILNSKCQIPFGRYDESDKGSVYRAMSIMSHGKFGVTEITNDSPGVPDLVSEGVSNILSEYGIQKENFNDIIFMSLRNKRQKRGAVESYFPIIGGEYQLGFFVSREYDGVFVDSSTGVDCLLAKKLLTCDRRKFKRFLLGKRNGSTVPIQIREILQPYYVSLGNWGSCSVNKSKERYYLLDSDKFPFDYGFKSGFDTSYRDLFCADFVHITGIIDQLCVCMSVDEMTIWIRNFGLSQSFINHIIDRYYEPVGDVRYTYGGDCCLNNLFIAKLCVRCRSSSMHPTSIMCPLSDDGIHCFDSNSLVFVCGLCFLQYEAILN